MQYKYVVLEAECPSDGHAVGFDVAKAQGISGNQLQELFDAGWKPLRETPFVVATGLSTTHQGNILCVLERAGK